MLEPMFRLAHSHVNQRRRRKSTITGLSRWIAARLAPAQCMLCDASGGSGLIGGLIDLCDACRAELPRAAPVPSDHSAPYELVCCPWSFEFPVADLVRALKFAGDRAPARLLGTLLALERAARPEPLPQWVVPVPLHERRLRERGYNQAAELARFAARQLQVRCDATALRRVRPTREQSALRAAERVANIQHAFQARIPLDGQRVALVDDVITTGSTAAAAAEALQAAGACGIELWVVARAVRRAQFSVV
jgi:ComF family protein